jgi:hypothetical protein
MHDTQLRSFDERDKSRIVVWLLTFLNLSDFYLWGTPKDEVCVNDPHSLWEWKENIWKEISLVPKQLCRVTRNIYGCEAFIQAGGRHFEALLWTTAGHDDDHEMLTFVYEYFFHTSKVILHTVKSYDVGPPKKGALRIFISFKNISSQPGLTREPWVQCQAR